MADMLKIEVICALGASPRQWLIASPIVIACSKFLAAPHPAWAARADSEQEWLDGMEIAFIKFGSNDAPFSRFSLCVPLGGNDDPEQWWTSD
eukprot:1960748-Karenia_brevis.AAC.1